MADVRVTHGTVNGGRISELTVSMHGLSSRTLDREATLRWMKDGHSFVPVVGGRRLPALQLVEVGDEHFVRTDNAPVAEDVLPAFA